MAIPISGKIYTFACIGAPARVLNLYYPNSIANGQNVCLWTSDSSFEQQWKYSDNKLLNMRNTNYALDKYTVSGNANNNNADIWTANDPTNQNIAFQAVSGNAIKIKLSSSGLYLTAASNLNGTSSGKTPSSTGNVYWASDSSSVLQKWTFKEVGGIPASGVGNGTLTVGQRPSTLNYNGGCYTKFSAGQCTWHAYGRAFEVTGKTLLFSATSGLHAKNWWKYVTNCTKSAVPVSNSIAVWDNGGKYGHIGYVEKVSDKTIYLTEANWDTANDAVDAEDGKVKIFTTDSIQARGRNNQYKIVGYLVL